MRARLLIRNALGCLLLAALVLVGGLLLRQREPAYKGKPLNAWIRELSVAPPDDESPQQVALRWQQLTNIIEATQPRALPCAITWIRTKPSQSPLASVADVVREVTGGRLSISGPQDHSREGVLVIRILGPAAQPALPDLASLVLHDQTSAEAAVCLAALGPASLPALSNAVATGGSRVRSQALEAVAELGPMANPLAPLLAQCATNPEPEIRAAAARALERLRDR